MNAKLRNDLFEIKGVVTETLPNSMYRVEVSEGPEQIVGKIVLCTLNGNMRRFNIRVLPGDSVLAEMSIYDAGRARITRRLRDEVSVQETDISEESEENAEEETTDTV